jgi:hypothetical protein
MARRAGRNRPAPDNRRRATISWSASRWHDQPVRLGDREAPTPVLCGTETRSGRIRGMPGCSSEYRFDAVASSLITAGQRGPVSGYRAVPCRQLELELEPYNVVSHLILKLGDSKNVADL